MNKYKYLFNNIKYIFIGNFSSKILVFLLIPLYTSVLTTEEYGSYDLLYTSVQLLMPILSLNIIDAVTRYSLEMKREKQEEVFTVSLKYVIFSIIILCIGVLCGTIFFRESIVAKYAREFILLYITYTINQLTIQFARGLDDVRGTAIAGVVGTVSMIAFNLFFLIGIKIGILGYFYANILSFGLQSIYLVKKDKMLKFITCDFLKLHKSDYEKEMLVFCLPLIFTTLSWYINNLSDRYIVTFICGVAVNGIYSLSYKIPAILNSVQSIFIQAWQLSAIRGIENEEGVLFFSKIYKICHAIMVLLCSGLIIFTPFIAKILFAKDFYIAWLFVPTLLLYVVFNTMSGIIGGVFSAKKDTGAFAKSAIAGAIINIVLNFILVYWKGAEGAALATVISSIVIWLMRYIYSLKHIKWKFSLKRHIVQYILLAFQAYIMTNITGWISYLAQMIILSILLMSNINILLEVKRK